MPGRPRTMLKRVDELMARAHNYGNDLLRLMPAQYRDKPNSCDRTCASWRQAANADVENYRALHELRDSVAEKAAPAEHLAEIMESAPS